MGVTSEAASKRIHIKLTLKKLARRGVQISNLIVVKHNEVDMFENALAEGRGLLLHLLVSVISQVQYVTVRTSRKSGDVLYLPVLQKWSVHEWRARKAAISQAATSPRTITVLMF